jgi:hypothetical protein
VARLGLAQGVFAEQQAEAAALLYTPVAGNALGVEDGPYFDVEINLRFEQVPGLCPQHGQQGQAAQGVKYGSLFRCNASGHGLGGLPYVLFFLR